MNITLSTMPDTLCYMVDASKSGRTKGMIQSRMVRQAVGGVRTTYDRRACGLALHGGTREFEDTDLTEMLCRGKPEL
jgi:hypothetical protein